MITTVRATLDAPVALVPWPGGGATRARARAVGAPRLIVVAPGAAPPADCALDEDWTTSVAPPADVAARMAALATRPAAAPRLPPDLAATLSDDAITAFVMLTAAPRAVATTDLREAIGHDALDSAIGELHAALPAAGYELLAVPGGVLLTRVAAGRPVAGPPAGGQRTR